MGQWYVDFEHTTDAEVRALLDAASTAKDGALRMNGSANAISERSVTIPFDGIELRADLAVPRDAHGIVIFAHGSGSSRMSVRNRAVATQLHWSRFATLLLDLLTPSEEREDARTGELRFDITLLALRLECATEWVGRDWQTEDLPVGYFGASTGAAAALVAAAHRHVVRAVVSRGGRPDLAFRVLADVRAPTLLIVGGFDEPVLDLNRDAFRMLHGEKHMEIIPRATHLFQEPGALYHVARLACQWFERYVAPHHIRTELRNGA